MFDKHRLTSRWPAAPIAATLLLLTLSVAGQARAQDIELRSYPLPGQQQRHTMGMRQTITGTLTAADGVEQKTHGAVDAERISLRKTGAEDAQGNYSLSFKFEKARTSIQEASGGSREITSPMAELEMQAVLNQARGDITDIKVLNTDADPKLLGMVSKAIANAVHALQALEGQRLRLGEPVETPFAMDLAEAISGVGNQMKATMRSTLVALEDGVATIDSDIHLTVELDSNTSPGSATQTARGSGQGNGRLKWRQRDRLLLQSEQNLQMQIYIPRPKGGTLRMQAQMEMWTQGESIAAR